MQTQIGVKRTSNSPAIQPGYNKDRVPAMKGQKWHPEIIPPDDVELLLCGCSKTSNLGARNAAIIATLYRTGVRIAELLAFQPADLDPEVQSMFVRCGKGGKARTVAIVGIEHPDALELIERWEERRAALLGIEDGAPDPYPLFCSLHGTPLSGAYVRTFLPRLAKQAGITRRIHPHAFRHSLAHELHMHGVPLNLIQRQLGHSSLATTAHYVDHVAPMQMLKALTAFDWMKPGGES